MAMTLLELVSVCVCVLYMHAYIHGEYEGMLCVKILEILFPLTRTPISNSGLL